MNSKKYIKEFKLVQVERPDRYGTVEGLDNEELANPEELERQVYTQELGPIMAVPVKNKWHGPRPEIDENGQVEWGAFGTIDFQRLVPNFDRVRYKIDRLKDELADVVLMIDIIKQRIPGKGKFLVLKYLKMGIIDLDHIEDYQTWRLATWYLKAWRLKSEIKELQAKREKVFSHTG